MADGIALRAHLDEHHDDHHRAVVVGGGYVGLEMAESMHQRGLPVTVVDSGEQPMSTLDPEIGARVADAMRAIGIDVRMQTRATGFETDTGDHVRAVSTSEGTIDADVVVLGIGVRPNVELAHDAGIALGPTGAIATDDRMQTSVAGVWAAGDCVEVTHRVTGNKAYVPLGTHANKQGRVVGVKVTGGDVHFRGVVGTAVTKICAYEIGRTGLSEREAKEAGFEVATATIETTTRAAYFPGAQPITVKVVAERPAGRLLGAQVFGREGAAKRVDIAAVAIWAGLAVDEIGQLDLGYAPPFSPLWDPVLVAANQAARELALW
jgi:NADPH-dependent 2,4-dienoyl-CoA reductase/sulfur reductase-like enzyme